MEIDGIKPVGTTAPGGETDGSAKTSDPVFKQPDVQAQTQDLASKKDLEPEKFDVVEAAEKLNKAAMIFDRSLKFQVHQKTNTTMVSVVDLKTDKVIREIPAKEVLDLVSKMQDYLGMIFDKKA